MGWKKAANSDSVKPAAIDATTSRKFVFVRKDFEEVPTIDQDGEQIGTHWEYMEQKIQKEDWEIYEQVATNTNGITDLENGICEESAVTEERLDDIENALCELSDAILG